MPIRAVVWDIDDTIFDYASADRAGMRDHLRAEALLGEVVSAESAEQALARWREITEAQWLRFAAGEATFEDQRRERVRVFLGRGLTDTEADAWFKRYVAHYEAAWKLFPDTLPALDLLAADYRHAVLSNSSVHNQDRKLRVLGVRDRFEALLCAAELGVSKPAAEAFHAACDALALPPGEVAYVGDQPDIDARGADEAGLSGIWLDRGGHGGRPELARITGLDQLPGLLRGNTRFGAPSTFG
ncbi:HAD family hydrolase [Streptomyces sp. H27-C3]|uniref:HAD family hydrolase n=1 Tax=Streptomyces sp. H27-C3 TaxID=3046305 RepID=UPI0024BADB90|nr:HAD family hydrolase [Streptomyces sp. H27-C3]MDJ0460859.1 HAD family hydrolase [Streptomyces sp. H27-C3]